MEQTNVVNAVTHHNKTVKTDIYVEARVFIGINACRLKYVRMRSAAGHYLNPANVLTYTAALTAANKAAHINLKTGLNEREEACSHSYGNVLTEHLGENALDHNLTGGICEILVNDKRLVLEECALVTCVGGFISIHASGVNESIRGLMLLHISYAAACKVGAKTELLVSLA